LPRPDLAQEAAELLSIANASESRSLNRLVVLAARQVPACSGATAVLWRGDEPAVRAASHPDLPELDDVQLASGRGPALDALSGAGPVNCPDTLAEDRWPEYTGAALRRGVRCCVTLAYRSEPDAVTLSLVGARPRALEPGQLAELLTAFGGAVMGNAAEYGEAKRTALQLRAAAESRALVDQAKGMLMQALGCSAEDALARLRQISQERNLRVTDVARTIIESRGARGAREPGSNGSARR
jgi:ANTAR domain-containing protein